MAGRLKDFYEYWNCITLDSRILSWIEGVKIPFKSWPTQSKPILERKWSQVETENMSSVILELIEKGAIVECVPVKGQFLSNIFLEPKPNKSFRLILNLKELNKFVNLDHFKIEDYKVAIKLIDNNCFMATLDLKDAYYLISIHESHRKFLRFEFSGKLYEFTCLPFGLCVAPQFFTKLMKPIVCHLRKLGFKLVLYLDDFLLLGDTYTECANNVQKTCDLLESLGFIINYSKSKIIPSQRCKYLGFIFDSSSMSLELPEERRYNVNKLIDKFSGLTQSKIRDFAQFIGSIVACCPVLKYSWMYTKNFERQKFLALNENNNNYDATMILKLNKSDVNW